MYRLNKIDLDILHNNYRHYMYEVCKDGRGKIDLGDFYNLFGLSPFKDNEDYRNLLIRNEEEKNKPLSIDCRGFDYSLR